MSVGENSILKTQLVNSLQASELCKLITADLPEWFDLPEVNEHYAKGMLSRTSFSAIIDKQHIGL